MPENGVQGLVNVRTLGSGAWKCQKAGFGGADIAKKKNEPLKDYRLRVQQPAAAKDAAYTLACHTE